MSCSVHTMIIKEVCEATNEYRRSSHIEIYNISLKYHTTAILEKSENRCIQCLIDTGVIDLKYTTALGRHWHGKLYTQFEYGDRPEVHHNLREALVQEALHSV